MNSKSLKSIHEYINDNDIIMNDNRKRVYSSIDDAKRLNNSNKKRKIIPSNDIVMSNNKLSGNRRKRTLENDSTFIINENKKLKLDDNAVIPPILPENSSIISPEQLPFVQLTDNPKDKKQKKQRPKIPPNPYINVSTPQPTPPPPITPQPTSVPPPVPGAVTPVYTTPVNQVIGNLLNPDTGTTTVDEAVKEIVTQTTLEPTIKERLEKKKDIVCNDDEHIHLEDMYMMLKNKYGSIYNFLGMGGPGTYVLLGPTEQGKSFSAHQLYNHAVSPLAKKNRINFEEVIVMSKTAKITKDYSWNKDIIKISTPNEDAIRDLLEIRVQEITEGLAKEGLSKDDFETYANMHPQLWISDDSYGEINMTMPGNAANAVATMARHYGIYFVVCIQYIKQTGPLFKDNARMWICIGVNLNDHKLLWEWFHAKNPDACNKLAKVTRKRYFIVNYIQTWHFGKECNVPGYKVFILPPMPDISKNIRKYEKYSKKFIKEKSDTSEQLKELGNMSD